MATSDFSIENADWKQQAQSIRWVREQVFIREQGVLPEEEWDPLDPDCAHLLARDGCGRPVGTARLTPDGHLGRMAVLREWRGRGIGSALLNGIVALARQRGFARLIADAQVQALGFYLKAGFRPQGGQFMEVRIPHQRVVLELQGRPPLVT